MRLILGTENLKHKAELAIACILSIVNPQPVLRQFSADFTELYKLLGETVTCLLLFEVSGRTNRGVTPSFHPSEYQFSKIKTFLPFNIVRKLVTYERATRLSLSEPGDGETVTFKIGHWRRTTLAFPSRRFLHL